jgi:all-trans-retinol 13,14-reductase
MMTDSVWKVKGGAKTLVDAFVSALKKLGADIFTGKKAVKIENCPDKKKVYFEDGTEIECGMCVSSIHPKEFIKIAPEGVYRKNGHERIKNIEETPSFFVLYGVLREGQPYKCTNITFLGEDGCDGIVRTEDIKPAYINFSDTEPQAVCAVAFIKPDEKVWDRTLSGYKEKKRQMSEKVKKKLFDAAPELAGKIEFCDTATPATFKSYVNYYGGYGIMHDVSGTVVLPVTKVPGIFLTGQAVVTPGLLGGMISSFLLYKIIERGNNVS